MRVTFVIKVKKFKKLRQRKKKEQLGYKETKEMRETHLDQENRQFFQKNFNIKDTNEEDDLYANPGKFMINFKSDYMTANQLKRNIMEWLITPLETKLSSLNTDKIQTLVWSFYIMDGMLHDDDSRVSLFFLVAENDERPRLLTQWSKTRLRHGNKRC